MAQKKYRQGYYKPKQTAKYRGNSSAIVFRSSWEKKVMMFFDESMNIEWWNSEGLMIPYFNPIDKKVHSYFPDFIFLNKKKETWIIEVKPYKETIPPSKRLRNYRGALVTYIINQSKWKSAMKFCEKQNIRFAVWTERELKKMGIL